MTVCKECSWTLTHSQDVLEIQDFNLKIVFMIIFSKHSL